VRAINAAADAAPDVLRISIDAKATVKIGPFARGGKSRAATKACDHDFKPEASLTPVGIFLPASDELFIYHVTSKVTSDCLLDRLVQWWEAVRSRFAHITTLVVNLDNGPENHSRRTQLLRRMVEFAQHYGLTVRLAYENALPQQVQSNRTLLGHSRKPLEWRTSGYSRCSLEFQRQYDLAGVASGRCVGHHRV
jgi:Rhodopirellula transposase DDE domain